MSDRRQSDHTDWLRMCIDEILENDGPDVGTLAEFAEACETGDAAAFMEEKREGWA